MNKKTIVLRNTDSGWDRLLLLFTNANPATVASGKFESENILQGNRVV